jgi:hypothetical protein
MVSADDDYFSNNNNNKFESGDDSDKETNIIDPEAKQMFFLKQEYQRLKVCYFLFDCFAREEALF